MLKQLSDPCKCAVLGAKELSSSFLCSRQSRQLEGDIMGNDYTEPIKYKWSVKNRISCIVGQTAAKRLDKKRTY